MIQILFNGKLKSVKVKMEFQQMKSAKTLESMSVLQPIGKAFTKVTKVAKNSKRMQGTKTKLYVLIEVMKMETFMTSEYMANHKMKVIEGWIFSLHLVFQPKAAPELVLSKINPKNLMTINLMR